MNRQDRISLHKKQEVIKLKEGVPSIHELTNGVPTLRSTKDGVIEYVKYNGVLYKNQYKLSTDLLDKSLIDVPGDLTLTSGGSLNLNLSSTLKINTNKILVTSTESTDSTPYPELQLYRNADVQDVGVDSSYGTIGVLYFMGLNSAGGKETYGYIRCIIQDDANGSEDAEIRMGTKDNGGVTDIIHIMDDKLGINTSPSYSLDVYDNVAADYVARFQNDGNNANRGGIALQCGADDGSGNTYYLGALDGDGTNTGVLATISGTFQLLDTSDIRLKKDIVDTSVKGLDSINAIKVRDFKWKESNESVTAGFIANELKEVCPHVVDGEPDDMNEDGSIKPMKISRELLVPVLTKAVQELSAKVDAMQIEINNLK